MPSWQASEYHEIVPLLFLGGEGTPRQIYREDGSPMQDELDICLVVRAGVAASQNSNLGEAEVVALPARSCR